jgi:hypothetical protein
MALCQMSHNQILIFKGILIVHKCLKDLSTAFLHRWLYTDLTVKIPFFVHFQQGLSLSCDKVACLTIFNNPCTWRAKSGDNIF